MQNEPVPNVLNRRRTWADLYEGAPSCYEAAPDEDDDDDDDDDGDDDDDAYDDEEEEDHDGYPMSE